MPCDWRAALAEIRNIRLEGLAVFLMIGERHECFVA
jgi:hypothetical protein